MSNIGISRLKKAPPQYAEALFNLFTISYNYAFIIFLAKESFLSLIKVTPVSLAVSRLAA